MWPTVRCFGHGVASKMAAQPSERGSQHQQRMQLLVPPSVLAALATTTAPAATWAAHGDVLLVLAAASFMQVIAMLFVPTELALPPTTEGGRRQAKGERGAVAGAAQALAPAWLLCKCHSQVITTQHRYNCARCPATNHDGSDDSDSYSYFNCNCNCHCNCNAIFNVFNCDLLLATSAPSCQHRHSSNFPIAILQDDLRSHNSAASLLPNS